MLFSSSPLVVLTEKGLYCQAGDFYIDPHRAVDVAVITHAHSDHARRGSKEYICVKSGEELLRTRLGEKINVRAFDYREPITLGDVKVSFHSAGHILGSAQVRLEHGGEVWVVSGDYKRDPDPSCEPFETVHCDTFITEATFGTPRFVWEKKQPHGELIHSWWCENEREKKNSLLFGYSLGKAQRILAELAPKAHRPVLIHDSIHELTECYRRAGRQLAPTRLLKDRLKDDVDLVGELILAPPSILTEGWIHRAGSFQTAFASGWMKGGSFGRERYDRGFVMSDHADWNDLNQTIFETGARRVFVQHRNGALVRHLRSRGIEAHPVERLRPQEYYPGENLLLL